MAVGDRTADSVIWFPGESTGRDSVGASAATPGENLKAASGSGSPSGAPSGAPIYVNTANNKLSVWDGSKWVAASGYNT